MRVSILIPVHDDVEGLRITLESLAKVDVGAHEVETIVCSDGGPPDISDLAQSFGCRLVELPENRGSYAARNLGLQVAFGEVLAFIDADERVDSGWLLAGMQALDSTDYVGGAIEIELPENPTAWQIYDRIVAFPVRTYLDHRHFAPTANLFVKRHVFEKVGGFEESLWSGGDREFGVRVYQAGFTMAHCDQAVTIHPARDFRGQAKKLFRVARGGIEVEYLAWERPAGLIFRQSLVAMLKAPLRALARIVGILEPPASNPAAWETRHCLMDAVAVVIHQSTRIRHLLRLVLTQRRKTWESQIRRLPGSNRM